MVLKEIKIEEGFWEEYKFTEEDIEYIYDHLLEVETPLTPLEILEMIVANRLAIEIDRLAKSQDNDTRVYLPKERYEVGEKVSFPEHNLKIGKIDNIRDGDSYYDESFRVFNVQFEDGSTEEYAFDLESHQLNNPPEEDESDSEVTAEKVLAEHQETLLANLIDNLVDNDDFVYIAGAWFPQALLVDVNEGNLVLADALLDMEGGGPLTTDQLLSQVGMPEGVNEKLGRFSLDMALQNDIRFDEVGSSGEVIWYLKRHEPKAVLETPLWLEYEKIDHDISIMNSQMIDLEKSLGDELSPRQSEEVIKKKGISISLIYPHWRSGTLPLSELIEDLFPSAFESPRIRIWFVDKKSGERFSGWVVRLKNYVYGLSDWYEKVGATPGSTINLEKGENPGEIIIGVDPHISAKEWVRTALVGADGKVVFANLKQVVNTSFDDRMMIAMPGNTITLDEKWKMRSTNPVSLDHVILSTLRELSKLSPQGHVHATELYSAVNMIIRCPPAPIMTTLESQECFIHVGDLHYRYEEAE
jgi:hypothetical protein